MDKTVGHTDRVVRIALGAVSGIASIGILLNQIPVKTIYSPVLGALALILLVTAFTEVCPAYSLLGMDTRE